MTLMYAVNAECLDMQNIARYIPGMQTDSFPCVFKRQHKPIVTYCNNNAVLMYDKYIYSTIHIITVVSDFIVIIKLVTECCCYRISFMVQEIVNLR